VVMKMFPSILADRLCKSLINHKMLTKFQVDFVEGNRTANNIFVIKL